jgi:hypothetical protein
VFVASLLRDAAARLRTWYSRSSPALAMVATSDATRGPSPQPTPPAKPRKLVDRIEAGREAVAQIQIASPPKRRTPIQPRPTLWSVKSSDERQRLYCGPVALAALIGADVDEAIRVIQRHRNNCRRVRGTHPHELQHAFRHFGRDMQLVADLSRNSPTLATWDRERTDWEFEQAWLLIVTGHWVAVRGRWFVDTWTAGKPVRIADAPWRRKRVRVTYRVTVAPS